MKTIQEIKKEDWNDEKLFKINCDKEEYYIINTFPYESWNPLGNKSLPPPKLLSHHEELRPEDFKVIDGNLIYKEKLDYKYTLDTPEIPIHYSTKRKDWEMDYCRLRTLKVKELKIDLQFPLGYFVGVMKLLRRWELKSKYKIIEDTLTDDVDYESKVFILFEIKLGRKNYFRFRKFLLDLWTLRIVVGYGYDEIRDIFFNNPVVVYV